MRLWKAAVMVHDVAGGLGLREWAVLDGRHEQKMVVAQASRAEEGRRIRTPGQGAQRSMRSTAGLYDGAVPHQDHKSGVVY